MSDKKTVRLDELTTPQQRLVHALLDAQAADLIKRTRTDRGLPVQIEDPDILDRLAGLGVERPEHAVNVSDLGPRERALIGLLTSQKKP
jgi:hypothetical protein